MNNQKNIKINNNTWLQNISGNWRDTECPCGSCYHFNGSLEELFNWEKDIINNNCQDTIFCNYQS